MPCPADPPPDDPFLPSIPTVSISSPGQFEEEITLVVPAKKTGQAIQADGAIDRCAVTPWSQRSLLTIYLDTSDRYLLRHRVALRLRSEKNRLSTLGLKGFGTSVNGVAKRREWEQNLTRPPDRLYPGLHYSDIPPGVVRDQLDRILASRQEGSRPMFLPLMESDVVRRSRRLALGGKGSVELALDEGVVRAGGKEIGLYEVEIECLSAPLSVVEPWASDLAIQYGLSPSDQSKFSLGLQLLGVQATKNRR